MHAFKFIGAPFIKFRSFPFTFLIISCSYKFFLQNYGVFLIFTNFSRFWWSKLSGFNWFLPAGKNRSGFYHINPAYNTSVPQAVRDKIVHSFLVHNILCLLNLCQKETVRITSFFLKYYDTLIQNKILWALISSSSAHLKYLRGQMFKTLIGISFQHLSITVGPVVNIFSQFWKAMALSNS